MARKKAEINVKSCLRLKLLLDDYNMKQNQLAIASDVSQTHINRIIKGHSNLTDAIAEQIVKAFPDEKPDLLKEWLMGRKDYRTTKEQLFNTVDEVHQEGELLSAGLSAFAQASGFSIMDATPLDRDNGSLDNFLHNIGDGFIISRNGNSVTLSPLQMNQLQNEICDYIEFTLDRIIKGKRSV